MVLNNRSRKTSHKNAQPKQQQQQQQQQQQDDDEDLISKLPEPILHHILSFLDTSFVIRTCSTLSSTWRYLWTSLPFLSFDYVVFYSFRRHRHLLHMFARFIDKVLHLRDHNVNIQSFRIARFDCREYIDEKLGMNLKQLICTLVQEYKLEVLHLDSLSYTVEKKSLPDCIFTCKTLVALTLSTLRASFSLHPDIVVCLPALKTLHLEHLSLRKGNSTNKFFSSCSLPVLETLIISNCNINIAFPDELEISVMPLKNLVVRQLKHEYTSCEYCWLKVIAPDLESFSCDDPYSLLHLPKDFRYVINRKAYNEGIYGILRDFRNIRILTLNTLLHEVAYEGQETGLRCLLAPFTNLRSLKLQTPLSRDYQRIITYLLESCPKVETLILDLIQDYSNDVYSRHETSQRKEVESSDGFLTSQANFNHLKLVQVRNFRGSAVEQDFLKFLLKNEKILERMNIYTLKGEMAAAEGKTHTKFIPEELTEHSKVSIC